MLHVEALDPDLEGGAVLRAWVRREARKPDYPAPDGELEGLDHETLVATLEETYDEPAEAATAGDPTWLTLEVSGTALGDLRVFPACGWDELAADGTVRDAVSGLQERGPTAFPDATAAVRTFRSQLPGASLGALVAREVDGEWPPVLLEGNHRACAAHWAAREGEACSLPVHLAITRPRSALPVTVD